MYDLNRIKEFSNTKIIGQTIIQYDVLSSTNHKAKKIFDKSLDGIIILSEDQTNCKMRFNKEWLTSYGKDIYMSIILKPLAEDYSVGEFEVISTAAVYKSINHIFSNVDCKIKWPNDIYISDKKVSSINCEIVSMKNKKIGVLIDIAINVNLEYDELDDELKLTATSIKNEIISDADREKLIAFILNYFELYYNELIDEKNIKDAVDVCMNNSLLIGKEIEIKRGNRKTIRKGKALIINEEGNLLIKNHIGDEEILNSGEISVRYIK